LYNKQPLSVVLIKHPCLLNLNPKPMKSIFLSTLVVLALNVSASITQTTSKVYFESARAQLDAGAQQTLDKLIEQVAHLSDHEIIIAGHTDDVGGTGYNDSLSLARARSVKAYFVAKGMDPTAIQVSNHGEYQPLMPNVNGINRQENRRVEVLLKAFAFESLEELEKQLTTNTTQTSIIDPVQSNLLVGRKGTRVLIEPGTFVDANGNPIIESVVVTWTEALSFADFVGHQLSTLSDGQLLESGGMLHIDAQTATGEAVHIGTDKSISYAIPTKQQREGMELFVSDQGANWAPTRKPVTRSWALKMPPYPKLQEVTHKLPKYRINKRNMPRKPVLPREPREPHEPKQEAFKRKISWYQWPVASILQAQSQKRFNEAMVRYEKRLEIFYKRLERYEVYITNYDCALEEYGQNMIDWKEQVAELRCAYYSTDEYITLQNKNFRLQELLNKRHRELVKNWHDLEKEKMGIIGDKMEALGAVDEGLLNSYVFAHNQLSWINVDRFYKQQMDEQRMLVMADPDTTAEKVFILFKEMNSLLPVYKGLNDYMQSNLPKNVDGVVFAYKVENGQAKMFQRNLDDTDRFALAFEPCKLRDIRNFLEQLNGGG